MKQGDKINALTIKLMKYFNSKRYLLQFVNIFIFLCAFCRFVLNQCCKLNETNDFRMFTDAMISSMCKDFSIFFNISYLDHIHEA